MKQCKYRNKNNSLKFNTIEELYKYLDETKEYLSVEDVIYSKEASKQTEQVNKFKELKEISISRKEAAFFGEEDFAEVGEHGEMSIGHFLDFSEDAMINGNRFYTPLDVENFKINRIKQYEKLGKTKEEAELLTLNEIDNWRKIEQNSADLHKLCISKYIGGSSETESDRRNKFLIQAKTILDKDSQLNNDTLLLKLFDQLSGFYKSTKDASKECVRGINIVSKLRDSNTSLFAHIDYAFIDDKGNLQIYNFKASSLYYADWSKEKRDKYLYEIAFIKQMLANNGINIKNIKMNIVPIHLLYNETFDKIRDIKGALTPIDYEFTLGARYKSTNYDNIAKYFLKPKTKLKPLKTSELSDNRLILNLIFPSLQVGPELIEKSAKEWIANAPSFGEEVPLVITEINDGKHRYLVIIDGEVYLISDHSEKKNNKLILKLVLDYLYFLNEDRPNYVNRIADAILQTIRHNLSFWDFKNIKNSSYLSAMLSPYLTLTKKTTAEGKEIQEYDWEFNDTLVDSGIFIFINKNTGLLDTITISDKNLRQIPDYFYGTNILGGYKTDRDFSWKGFYGNVESVRTLIMLNNLVSEFPDGIKLGTQHILGYQGLHMQYSMEHIIKLYLPTILQTAIKYNENSDLKIENNYKNVKFVDNFENLVDYYTKIVNGRDSSSILLNELIDEDELKKAMTREEKAKVLLSILERFLDLYSDIARDPQLVIKESRKSYLADLANFYIKASQAYLYYTNAEPNYDKKLELVERYMYTAPTVPRRNINLVVTNLQATIDSIASDCESEYTKHLRSFIMEFYKDAGYTSLLNMTLGNQTSLFENMYAKNERGEKTMRFKNPYNDPTLKEYERKFLKKALFYLNKYNFIKNDIEPFEISDDAKISEYITKHPEYLNVPLERASNSSRRQRGLSDRISRIKRTWGIIFKNRGSDIYDEFVNDLTKEEREFLSLNLEDLQMKDSFNRNAKERDKYIANNGVDYFETNIENLLIDRMFSAILTEKMNRMLIGTKALLLLLEILGEHSGFEDIFEKETKYIKDYIGLNVFKKPIIEEGFALKITGLGLAARSKVTFLNLAGNVISAVRDTMNGFMENYLRTVSRYLTDISKENMTKAYGYVVTHSTNDAMKVNLLSKLCVRYRISNTDTARITERLRTNRQGLSNWDNIAYSTLRSPDFLNRMTLFVGKAMQDGVMDAWSINENDELIYNWRKDKRFSVYADPSLKGTDKYREQQALYMLHIQEWNKDHPEMDQLSVKDDLPSPYSDQEILAIKNVALNIYGSYDKSLRSMSEFTSIGTFFGMYTTWMNGIWNNWMMKPGEYNVHKMKTEQEVDVDGSPLWKTEDGEITKVITGIPCLKHVPIIVQGVIPTLGDALVILHRDGLTSAIEYIKGDENTSANLRHALYSSLLGLFFFLLLSFLLTPNYEKTKKGYKDMNTMAILLNELAYKSFKPAVDSFYGPLNIIEYLGEGTNPPIYNVPTKFIKDSYSTIFGEKTVGLFVTNNFAFLRLGKELSRITSNN